MTSPRDAPKRRVHPLTSHHTSHITSHHIIDLHYCSYAWASQHSLKKNVYKPLYFFNHQDVLIRTYQYKKWCLNIGLFSHFHMEILGSSLFSQSCQYSGTIECSIWLVTTSVGTLFLHIYFLISTFLEQEIVTQAK